MEPLHAERKSLDQLRQKLGQLFHSLGDLDAARDALVTYEAYRFDTSFERALGVISVQLKQWLREWWEEKLLLLAIAMHAEGVDYIRNCRSAKPISHIRVGVIEMMASWDPTTTLSLDDFSVPWVRTYSQYYYNDRHLIQSLFEQLPKTAMWRQGQNTVVLNQSGPLFQGIPHVSSNYFNSISEIYQHTKDVVEVIEAIRISNQLAQLQAAQNQTTHQLTTVEATQMETLRRQNAALQRVNDDLNSKLLIGSRVALNTFDRHWDHSQVPSGNGSALGYGHATGSPPMVYTNSPMLGGLPHFGHVNTTMVLAPPTTPEPAVTFDELCEGLLGEIAEYTGDFEDVSVNTFKYISTTEDVMDQVLKSVGMTLPGLSALYPMKTQRIIWEARSAPQKYAKAGSVASLYHQITTYEQVYTGSDKTQNLLMMKDDLCRAISTVIQWMGDHAPVHFSDLGPCSRKFTNFPGKFHLCPGSHSSASCPQASFSDDGGSDKFQEVYAKMALELLTDQCRKHPTTEHDPAQCEARKRQFAVCAPCRTYIQREVYPSMCLALIQCLNDPSISETLKHGHRIQLAVHLLSVAWTKQAPLDFQSAADVTQSAGR